MARENKDREEIDEGTKDILQALSNPLVARIIGGVVVGGFVLWLALSLFGVL